MNKNKQLFTKLCIFLTVIGLCLGLAACGNSDPSKETDRKYDAAEVELAARELLQNSYLLCDIYYGEGIPVKQGNKAFSSGRYTEADPDFLEAHSIRNIADLKAMTQSVFSEEHSDMLFSTVLTVVKDGEVPISVTRYFDLQSTDKRPYYFMVDTKPTIYYKDSYEYDVSTLRATHAEGKRVFVEIEVTVTRSDDGKTQTRKQSLALVEQEDGWRLDSMPGAVYSEYHDRVDS